MACIITYNNKKYTQPEFNEYFKSHFFEFAGDFIGSKEDIEGFKKYVKSISVKNQYGLYKTNTVKEEAEVVSEETEQVIDGKRVVVPMGSNPANTSIFETEDTVFLMNDGQQAAYDSIKSFVLERLKVRTNSLGNKVTFDSELSRQYSDVIPADMWNNMIGLIGKGGTGKTSVIRKIMKDVAEEFSKTNKYRYLNVTYAAPTHNAVTMLQESLGLDSETTEGVKTTASLVARNQDKLSKRAEKGNPEDELLLLSEEIYVDSLQKGFITPISAADVIIIDEASMIGSQFMEDLLFRFKTEGPSKMPIFIFMGDYRQLPPVQTTNSKEFREGIISATLFSDESKSHELKEVMRTKDKAMHNIFDAVGNQITQQRKDYNEGKPVQAFDFEVYDAVSNKSTSNILIVNQKQVEAMIDDYTNVLVARDNPYEMFWVHYNKLSHRNTQELFAKIRNGYFKKLGVTNVPSTAIKGDYVQFKGTLPMRTSKRQEEGIESGTVKPTARFKVISREPIEFNLGETVLKRYFGNIFISGEGMVVYNRQNKKRFITAGDKNSITVGQYDAVNKAIEISVRESNGNVKTVKVPYRDYKLIEAEIKSLTRTLDEMFEPSYIGSTHTVQGASIKKVIVGDYNVRLNAPNINMRDMESSLYTALTRASEHLIIIKPDAIGITDNQEVFDLGVNVDDVNIPEVTTDAAPQNDMTSGLNDDFSKWDKVVELSPAGLPQIVVDLRKQSKCQ